LADQSRTTDPSGAFARALYMPPAAALDMGLYVPSMGRAGAKRPVLCWLPESLLPHTTLVVPPGEREEYLAVARRFGCRVASTPPGEHGIAATRLYIGKFAAARGQSKFCMLDDDIDFYWRPDLTDYHLRPAPPEIVSQILRDVAADLDRYAHVGVSGREGNNRVAEVALENVRYVRLLAYRTEEFLACDHGRVPVMEDFDVALQLLRRGHSCKVWFCYAQGQDQTNSRGGCSTYRTRALQEKAARQLAELHPGLVRVLMKHNKTDAAAFGTRVDVKIAWKRALNYRPPAARQEGLFQ
jgi:TET-associated glycosyltransferase-like protein